jgi:hypothetical protein
MNPRRYGANARPMPGRVNVPAFSAFRYRNFVERFFSR